MNALSAARWSRSAPSAVRGSPDPAQQPDPLRRVSRLHRVVRLGVLLFVFVCSVSARAQQPPAATASNTFETAVARGTAFLVSQQIDSGAFVDKARPSHPNAFTGLSLMALAAVGHQVTDDTPEGRAMTKGLEFILGKDRQVNGYYGGSDGSRMYGHGIVTLMLSEMLGMGVDDRQDALIREHCQRAIDLIIQAQKRGPSGGWRYEPTSTDADLSVTIWQVMALRAAKNAGLDVPKETIDKAVAYVKAMYSSPRDAAGQPTNLKTACGYTGGGPSYASGNAGLLALQVCGEYDAGEVIGSANWARELKLPWGADFFFYGTYYYAAGMYQRGGEFATESRRKVEAVLLAHQGADGAWMGAGQEANKVYATAMALLSLSVRHHFMPIYQR